MGIGGKILTALAVSLLPFTGAVAGDTVTLKPSTVWAVNYADDACELARGFGEGEELTTLHLYRFQPGDWFQLFLIGKGAKAPDGSRRVRIQFGPTEEPFDVPGAPITSPTREPMFAVFSIGSIGLLGDKKKRDHVHDNIVHPYQVDPSREKAVTEIRFLSGLRDRLILETGTLGKPFEALRACNEELMHHWGIDVEKQHHLTREATPKGHPENWLESADYPPEMLHVGRDGYVVFRLIVEPTGEVSSCIAQQTLMPKNLRDFTCQLIMKRAKFLPALDAEGQPIKSYWSNAVHWVSSR